jgi:PIN domain nuclease of toxin-antitoxin system
MVGMMHEQNAVCLLNRFFADAARRPGADPLGVAHEVAACVAALPARDRLAIADAVERTLAFRAPAARPRPLH